jgi:hypothetical protein
VAILFQIVTAARKVLNQAPAFAALADLKLSLFIASTMNVANH